MTKRARQWDTINSIVLIGTYLPRRCGIATFTKDLSDALVEQVPDRPCWALAVNDHPAGLRYPHRVKFEINQNRITDYRLAADFLNMSQVDVVSLQHEFGIFGGDDGRHIIELLRRLRTPVATTLHTVLDKPTDGQRLTLQRIAEFSERVIVMAHRAVEYLRDIYNVPEEKIVHIPHGIPDVPFVDPNFYKDQYGVEGKKVILTFGLLSPGKGVESMINALPAIVKAYPDVVYIVLGATHPHVQVKSGEDYRTQLQRRADENNVGEHVIFHNRFVELQELCEFLGAADVYVTPYLNEAQIVSGTLAYALGAGTAAVSTPYWYAQEMLADGRGRIVPFANSEVLAATIIDLFGNETERHAIRKRAYTFTRNMVWEQVARQYLDLFAQIHEQRARSPRPILTDRRLDRCEADLPQFSLDHLHTLTDDTGIMQHAKGIVPNRFHGYCTDDAARALIVVLMARDHVASGAGCAALATRYLGFLNHALDPETGRFRNFMGYDRTWLEKVGSEDSHGRAVWALGETVARSDQHGQSSVAIDLFHFALPPMLTFTYPRAWAYGLIGIHAYLRRFGGHTEIRRIRDELSHRLMELFRPHGEDDWPWPEPCLTYANARLPHALLLAGQWMFDQSMIDMAIRVLDWLITVQTGSDGQFSPVGNNGWLPRGGAKARFDQQPIEATVMIDACLEAARATGESRWVDQAHRCLNWFLGDNDVRVPLFDPTTGGCSDGLHPEGASDNQGAESTLSWLMAALAIYEHRLTVSSDEKEETSTSERARTDQTVVSA